MDDGIVQPEKAALKAADLRRRAEACRRLADMSDTEDRKSLWRQRADDWDQTCGQGCKAAAVKKTNCDASLTT